MSDLHVKKGLGSLSSVSRETEDRLRVYVDLLKEWQQAINLVSASTLPMVWERHVLDSVQVAKYIPQTQPSPCLVDLGSGAGFPGMVLAIMGVGRVHMIESDQRKCVFLREVARATDTEVTVHAYRIEAVKPFPADIITARALAPVDRLLTYAKLFLATQTRCLFLKGRNVESELAQVDPRWTYDMTQHPSQTEEGAVVLELNEVQCDL